MHIFIKVGGREMKGERKIKLLKHIFALYSLPLIFYIATALVRQPC